MIIVPLETNSHSLMHVTFINEYSMINLHIIFPPLAGNLTVGTSASLVKLISGGR